MGLDRAALGIYVMVAMLWIVTRVRRSNGVLDYVCATADRQAIYYLWRPTLPDAGDDLVLEVAAHGRCDRIVTFNVRDFAGSERVGVQAQTPRDFLLSLGAV